MIKYTFVWSFHQFRSMPWGRWGLRFAILSQTILPLFVSAPLHPPVINRFSNIITYIFSKRINDIEPRKRSSHMLGSRLGIIEALDLVNYWKCWVRQHPDSNRDQTQKIWQLTNCYCWVVQILNVWIPDSPYHLIMTVLQGKVGEFFAVLFANFWPTIKT